MLAKSCLVVKAIMFLPACTDATWVFFYVITWTRDESHHDKEVSRRWLLVCHPWYDLVIESVYDIGDKEHSLKLFEVKELCSLL